MLTSTYTMWLVDVFIAGELRFSGRMKHARDAIDAACREAQQARARGWKLEDIKVLIKRAPGGEVRRYHVVPRDFSFIALERASSRDPTTRDLKT
jgi:hypothetical protein